MTKTDTGLVRSFLKATERIASPDDRGRLVGVSGSTVRRWQAELEDGEVRPLKKRVRVAIEDYLAGPAKEGGQYVDGYVAAISEMEEWLAALRKRAVGGGEAAAAPTIPHKRFQAASKETKGSTSSKRR